MSERSKQAESLPPDDANLYCLTCGYNLRGLTGLQRRCPECGHVNEVALLRIPARAIAEQIVRLETAPALCMGALLSMSLGLLCVYMVLVHNPWQRSQLLVMSLACLTLGAVVAPLAAWRFAVSCRYLPGWGWALLRFLAVAVAMFVVGYGGIIGAIVLGIHLAQAGNATWGRMLLAWAMGLGTAVLALIGVLRLHLVARRQIVGMQRGTAVEMARRALRAAGAGSVPADKK